MRRACLADFGLATIVEESHILSWSTLTAPSGGTPRWLAPELLAPETDDGDNHYQNTRATDIFAFGCVGYEVCRPICIDRVVTSDPMSFADIIRKHPFPHH